VDRKDRRILDAGRPAWPQVMIARLFHTSRVDPVPIDEPTAGVDCPTPAGYVEMVRSLRATV